MTNGRRGETLGDVLWAREARMRDRPGYDRAVREEFLRSLPADLLTARVIPGPTTCETCGGDQRVPDSKNPDPKNMDDWKPCPDCFAQPQPVTIVMQEAWENADASVRAVLLRQGVRLSPTSRDRILAAALPALAGGGVERATGYLVVGEDKDHWMRCFAELMNPGDRIAVLKREAP